MVKRNLHMRCKLGSIHVERVCVSVRVVCVCVNVYVYDVCRCVLRSAAVVKSGKLCNVANVFYA